MKPLEAVMCKKPSKETMLRLGLQISIILSGHLNCS